MDHAYNLSILSNQATQRWKPNLGLAMPEFVNMHDFVFAEIREEKKCIDTD